MYVSNYCLLNRLKLFLPVKAQDLTKCNLEP